MVELALHDLFSNIRSSENSTIIIETCRSDRLALVTNSASERGTRRSRTSCFQCGLFVSLL